MFKLCIAAGILHLSMSYEIGISGYQLRATILCYSNQTSFGAIAHEAEHTSLIDTVTVIKFKHLPLRW